MAIALGIIAAGCGNDFDLFSSVYNTPSLVLNGDVTWSGTQSVTAYTIVAESATLTIDAGTVINYNSSNFAKYDEILTVEIRGTLVARGTSGNPIICQPANPSSVTGFCAFWLSDNAEDALYGDGTTVFESGSIIEYCRISQGMYGIYLDRAAPLIKNCTVTQCYSEGIASFETDTVVDGCLITGNGVGISIGGKTLDGKNATVKNSTISWSETTGIYCINSDPSITLCDITDNGIAGDAFPYDHGIECNIAEPDISKCNITDNLLYGIYITPIDEPGYSLPSPAADGCYFSGNTTSYSDGVVVANPSATPVTGTGGIGSGS